MDIGKQISYIQTPRTTSLAYFTVKQRLQTFAENTPTKEACVVYDINRSRSSITCLGLYNKACSLAHGLLRLGIRPGDIVGVSLPNGPDWMICVFGIQIAGAVPLLFKFYRSDGTDISTALKKARKCTAVIFYPGHDNTNLNISRCFIQEFKENGVIKSNEVPSLKYGILSRHVSEIGNALTIKDVLADGGSVSDNSQLPNIDPDDLAAIVLSSGTTGTPKPIQFTHLNLLEVGRRHSEDSFFLRADDIYYNGNSFNWGGAYPHTFLFKGTTRVSCSDILNFKSVEEINDFISMVIAKEKCTVAMIGVPSVLAMIKHDTQNMDWASTLRSIAVAGLPIPSTCSGILNKLKVNLIPMYGATEIGSISSISIQKGDAYEDYCVGTPFSGYELKIVDKSGQTVPLNTFGEVYIRNSNVHLGYHNAKELTDRVFTSTGWYKTDDVGCMRENGTVVVPGRISDMLLIGEELLSPAYLEREIQKHPGVREVVVVPIADDITYQQACACIIPEDQALSEMKLKEFFDKTFSSAAISRGFVPKYCLFFESFPKSPLGKLSHRGVKEIAIQRLSKERLQ